MQELGGGGGRGPAVGQRYGKCPGEVADLRKGGQRTTHLDQVPRFLSFPHSFLLLIASKDIDDLLGADSRDLGLHSCPFSTWPAGIDGHSTQSLESRASWSRGNIPPSRGPGSLPLPCSNGAQTHWIWL